MTDTTLQSVPDEPSAVPRPLISIAQRLLFSNADSAAKWAKSLPFMPVAQAHDVLVAQLRALAAAEFPARERAKIAEILRDQVCHLHTELARRYAGKPQPEGERESEAIDQSIALWQALWEQYSACLKPLLEGDAELEHRVRRLVLGREVLRDALVEPHRVLVVGNREIRLADPEQGVVGELAGRIAIEDLLEHRARVGVLVLRVQSQRAAIDFRDVGGA